MEHNQGVTSETQEPMRVVGLRKAFDFTDLIPVRFNSNSIVRFSLSIPTFSPL